MAADITRLRNVVDQVMDQELKPSSLKRTLESFSGYSDVDDLVNKLVEKILDDINNRIINENLTAFLPKNPKQLFSSQVLLRVNTALSALSNKPEMPLILREYKPFLILTR